MNTYKVGQGRQTTSAIALIALASLAPLRLPTTLQLTPVGISEKGWVIACSADWYLY